MDIPTTRYHKDVTSLASSIQKAREILSTNARATGSRLQTPEGSSSDLSDSSQGSYYGYSALHAAVISRDREYLDFLLKGGYDLDQRDDNGFTALHVATLEKSLDCVQCLIFAGSDVESLTKEGMSALHIAVSHEDNVEVLSVLAASCSTVNIRNKVGRTALHLAAKTGNPQYLEVLLDAGCDREIKDKFGLTAVNYAEENNHEECVQFLLHYIPKPQVYREYERNNICRQDDKTRISNGSGELERKYFVDQKAKKETNLSTDCKSELRMYEEVVTTEQRRERKVVLSGSVVELEDTRAPYRNNVSQKRARETRELLCDKGKNPSYLKSNNDKKFEDNVTKDLEVEETNQVVLVLCCEQSRQNGIVSSTEEHDSDKRDNGWNKVESILCSGNQAQTPGLPAMTDVNGFHQCVSSTKSAPSSRSVETLAESSESNFVEDLSPNFTAHLINNKRHPRTIDSEQLFTILTVISQPKQIHLEDKPLDISRIKREIHVLHTAVSFIPRANMKLKYENLCPHLKLYKKTENGLGLKSSSNLNFSSSDIVCEILEGLGMSMRIYNTPFSGNGRCLDSKRFKSHLRTCAKQEFVDLLIKASDIILVLPKLAYKLLDRACGLFAAIDAADQILIYKLFTRCKLIKPSNGANERTSSICGTLLALEYVIQQDKTPPVFSSVLLDTLVKHPERMRIVMTTRSQFIDLAIDKTVSAGYWDEEKMAEFFVSLSVVLQNTSFLCTYVDILLRQTFSRCNINNMVFTSCVLARMGLLKSESKMRICSSLKGPLEALQHAFTQEYFPRCLAGVFVSFLAKPSPRFENLEDLHILTLESAILREILPDSYHCNASVLGKGFKRICDVLAHGEYWPTAYQCTDTLFDKAFRSTSCKPMELGESILIYLGLIKSEVQLETIGDINSALKLLRHVTSTNRIPECIAPMLIVFLNKEDHRLDNSRAEVHQLVKMLSK